LALSLVVFGDNMIEAIGGGARDSGLVGAFVAAIHHFFLLEQQKNH